MPIPREAIGSAHRRALGLPKPTGRVVTLQKELAAMVRKLSRPQARDTAPMRTLRARVEDAVTEIYRLSEEYGNA